MPTYEYRCEKCGHEFEEYQRITAPALKACPKCKGKVKRIVSGGSGFILKGSGFYATDYAKKRTTTHDTPKAEETAKTEGKKAEETAKTESKKAAPEKKETKPKSD